MKLNIKKIIKFPLDVFKVSLYPNKCISCLDIIEEGDWLCEICRRELEYTDLSKWCFICGYPKEKCLCKSRVYYFEKSISPLYKRSVAQKAYYRCKFNDRPFYTKFFAEEMAKAVRQHYKDIKFDVICPVPTSAFSRRKYGFDPTLLLSKHLSAILNIPYTNKIIGCYPFILSQRLYTGKERFKAVQHKYYIKGNAKNKTVLLVDDIKTTGATMSECAHLLLKAGAERVYCVSALVTVKSEENKNKNSKHNGDKNGN